MFLLEITNKVPTIENMYAGGLILALTVFGATYFHRQVGLIILFLVGMICAQGIGIPDIVQTSTTEVRQNHLDHWNYSSRMTFALSVILFFTAIILKRRLKRKNKLD